MVRHPVHWTVHQKLLFPMYLVYALILLAVLVPCMLALYVWQLYRGGDENAPGDPPPPPRPETPDPVDSPVSRDYGPSSISRDSERTRPAVHA